MVPEGSREEWEEGPMQFLLQAVPRDPRPLLPFPPGPLRSVEVGCARSPSNSEASSNRSHHNDAAIRLGGESHLWTGRACGGHAPHPDQTPSESGGEGVLQSTLGLGEVLVFSNAPICQWIFSLARALPTSGQEQGAKQSRGVRVSCPLWGFRILFAHPAPGGKPPPLLLG